MEPNDLENQVAILARRVDELERIVRAFTEELSQEVWEDEEYPRFD
jgi:hypothetical protein